MKKRLKAIFSGSVHGVGFRYTADRLSRRFEVTGFVKNLPNGKVELVAEGEESILRDYLKSVSDAMQSYIRDTKIEWSEFTGEFASFGVAF